MSHAAIVCREYGLPAVTGTGTASTTIKTGQLIRVDGSRRPGRDPGRTDRDPVAGAESPAAPCSSRARPAASAAPSPWLRRPRLPRRGRRHRRRRRRGDGAPGKAAGADVWSGRLDVTVAASTADVAAAVAEFGDGRIDVLRQQRRGLRHASPAPPLEEIDPAEWDRVMAVNLKGPWMVARACSPFLPDGARIINISSATSTQGSEHWLHYVASKGGVISHDPRHGQGARTPVASPSTRSHPGFTLTDASRQPDRRRRAVRRRPRRRCAGPVSPTTSSGRRCSWPDRMAPTSPARRSSSTAADSSSRPQREDGSCCGSRVASCPVAVLDHGRFVTTMVLRNGR